MNKKKILITGYPFTGTTILKSKLGECKNIHEVVDEVFEIRQNHIDASGDKEFILAKTPPLPLEIRVHGVKFLTENHPNSQYKDYKIIFVTRNPWNVFSSTIKAGFDPLSDCTNHHKVEYFFKLSEYLVSLERFIEARDGNFPNIYAVKYEDFFVDDNKKLFDIMDNIGLEYDNDIFKTKTKKYHFRSDIDFDAIKDKPEKYDLGNMRTWQINQPFQNMNGDVDIPDELSDILENSPIIKQLGYTDPRK